MISPSMSGVTLIHRESDVGPECRVVFAGGRIQENGLIDSRRIELAFESCALARAAPKHDNKGLDAEGFELLENLPADPRLNYLRWLASEWKRCGYCPRSGMWIATQSAWVGDDVLARTRHYVVCGRDGYVELIARSYSWREWLWVDGHREGVPGTEPVIASGMATDDAAT
jgi:hypothetical protein